MRRHFSLALPGRSAIELGARTAIVGVVNVTPDSFSDGGRFLDPAAAIDRALALQDEDADILEVGGESSRPGAAPLTVEEEWSRISEVVRVLGKQLRVPLAVDTYKSEVAERAADLGAAILNDISALRFDPRLGRVAAAKGCALVLMHMRGTPQTMQHIPPSLDIIAEIESDLREAISRAVQQGVERGRIVIDPGIGFGKSAGQNLEIIAGLDRLAGLGLPIMVGPSRKSFIGKLTGRAEAERQFGTAAAVAASILNGAHMIRVHDVGQMVDVVRLTDAIAACQNRN